MASKKDQIVAQIQQETAMANARNLLQAINNNCFDRCIPKPGASLSSGESTCYTACMEKYMRAWDRVSQVYTSRLQQEQQNRQLLSNNAGFSMDG